jgi:hypothetical protein
MPYAIGNVIYGWPFPAAMAARIRDECSDRGKSVHDLKTPGLSILYSASDSVAGFVGVKVGSIDECDSVRVGYLVALAAGVTEAQRDAAVALRAALPKRFQKMIGTSEPDLWVVWSSS